MGARIDGRRHLDDRGRGRRARCSRSSTPSCPTGSRPAPGPSRPPSRAATSRSSASGPEHLSIALDKLVDGRRREVDRHDRRLPGDSGRRPAAGGRRRDPALPGLPDRPAALRDHAATPWRDGSAMVTENLFEARFRTVQELDRLGAERPHRRPPRDGARRGAALRRSRRGQRHPGRGGPGLAGLVADGRDHRQRRPAHRPRLRRLRRRPCAGSAPTSAASQTRTSSSDAGFARGRCGWLPAAFTRS